MGNEKQVAATAERIRELRVLCEKYGLSGREAAERYTDEELSGKITTAQVRIRGFPSPAIC